MSVVIKSNQVSRSNFGDLSYIGKDSKTIFNDYKSRVEADGGIINDNNAVNSVISFVTGNGIEGLVHFAVSGKFGVKKNSEGKVVKLYSVFGDDFNLITKGSGEAPTLTEDNLLDFRSNDPTTTSLSGAFFGTDKAVNVSRTNRIGYYLKSSVLFDGLLESLPADMRHTAVGFGGNEDVLTPISEVNFNSTELRYYYGNLEQEVRKNFAQLGYSTRNYPRISLLADASAGTVKMWDKSIVSSPLSSYIDKRQESLQEADFRKYIGGVETGLNDYRLYKGVLDFAICYEGLTDELAAQFTALII